MNNVPGASRLQSESRAGITGNSESVGNVAVGALRQMEEAGKDMKGVFAISDELGCKIETLGRQNILTSRVPPESLPEIFSRSLSGFSNGHGIVRAGDSTGTPQGQDISSHMFRASGLPARPLFKQRFGEVYVHHIGEKHLEKSHEAQNEDGVERKPFQ